MAEQQSPTLQPPGGGSTVDPMLEARVATLESDVRNIRDNVAEMKLDLRDLRTDLKDLREQLQGSRFEAKSSTEELRAATQAGFTELRVNLATLTERVAHLPSKGYIGWCFTFSLSAMVAVLTILSRLGLLAMGAK